EIVLCIIVEHSLDLTQYTIPEAGKLFDGASVHDVRHRDVYHYMSACRLRNEIGLFLKVCLHIQPVGNVGLGIIDDQDDGMNCASQPRISARSRRNAIAS